MLVYLAPEGELFEAAVTGEIASGTFAQEVGVVIVTFAWDTFTFAVSGCLSGEIVKVWLAKCTEVEPVIAHPSVDHRAFRRGHFERRMRIDERHDDGETFVRRTEHSYFAVRL